MATHKPTSTRRLPSRATVSKTSCTPLFSPEDADLSRHFWKKTSCGYVARYFWNYEKAKTEYVLAHREVTQRFLGRVADFRNGEVTDHINRNRLDNRRENLRIVTRKENYANSAWHDSAKGYSKRGAKFYARICISYNPRRTLHLGVFSKAKDARAAYLAALQKHFPSRYAKIISKTHQNKTR